MGYRVGVQCFLSKEAATDYKMSVVAPEILSDGQFVYPIKQGDKWLYQGQVVELSFAECDPQAEFKAGQEVAFAFVALFALVFMFKFVVKFIYSAYWLETDVADKED